MRKTKGTRLVNVKQKHKKFKLNTDPPAIKDTLKSKTQSAVNQSKRGGCSWQYPGSRHERKWRKKKERLCRVTL